MSGSPLPSPFAVGLLALALACGPKKVPVAALGVPATDSPILPSPDATLYATGSSLPRDVLVAQVVEYGLLPWQESLAGAATALVLDHKGPLDLSLARHAAWRSGYPYPVVQIVTGDETAGVYPAGLVTAVQRALKAGDHVGVVRARVGPSDRWVALIGRSAGVAEALPRASDEGARLHLAAYRAGSFSAVTPSGGTRGGPLPADLRLDEPGEWWIQLDAADGRRILGVPVAVGMEPPPGSIFDLPGSPPTGPSESAALAFQLVNEVREAFARSPVVLYETLQTLAQHPLEQLAAGTWTRSAGESRLRGAGFVGGPIAQVTCKAATVEICLDQLLASTEGRAVLLQPQVRLGGVAAQVRTDGLLLAINLAAE